MDIPKEFKMNIFLFVDASKEGDHVQFSRMYRPEDIRKAIADLRQIERHFKEIKET